MQSEIRQLLNANNSKNDGLFINISLEEYVTKIVKYATIVPYWVQGNLKGFIAYYNNDKLKEEAFLTMIVIDKQFQGRGLGNLLLELSIKDLIKNGFKKYGLEVLKDNENAIRLYSKLGFVKKEVRGELWYMEKILV